jgi:hypothetical protein
MSVKSGVSDFFGRLGGSTYPAIVVANQPALLWLVLGRTFCEDELGISKEELFSKFGYKELHEAAICLKATPLTHCNKIRPVQLHAPGYVAEPKQKVR